MQHRMARAIHRGIETFRRAAAEISQEKQPQAVRKGMRMLVELEAGALRQVLREGKNQTEQDQRLAEGCQRQMWAMKVPQHGFG